MKYRKDIAKAKAEIISLKEDGYEVFKSLSAGSNSSYSFTYNGKKDPYGYDSWYSARMAALEHRDNAKKNKE